MGERWVAFFVGVVLCGALFLAGVSSAEAHKSPIIEYTYVGHIWEEAYTSIPRQVVVDEPVILKAGVTHPGEIIDGEVKGIFSIYQDDTIYRWYGGESYKSPKWLLIKEAEGTPTGNLNEFSTEVIIDREGSYQVFVDWYEDGQYIGQSMHMLDVEARTIGPLYMVFSLLIVIATLIGVRKGIL